ncbi:MAG TPA: hypothetical protein VHT27_06065 [Solirubrobacteraceae bacterium]|nr:hypothetical protein [Solirubrobacteraceae bacterium]
MSAAAIRCRCAASIGAIALLAAGSAPAAQANRLAVLSCHGPGGEALGDDGWLNERTADGDMVALDTCGEAGAGSLHLELAGNSGGYGNGAQTEWVFTSPSWGSIVSYRVQVADSFTTVYGEGGADGVGQAFVIASDESDPNYDYRNLGSGSFGASVLERTPPAPDHSLVLNASCDGQSGTCPANMIVSRLDVSATRVTLNDPSTPTVNAMTGSLLASNTLRGTVALNLAASDEGPGVYSAALILDGVPQAPQIFDTNGGWCESLGPSGEAPRSFAHPDPCPQHASTTLTLDTTGLADGTHTIALRVDDASGNATTPLESTIQTDNAPQSSAPPQIAPAAPTVGATLTATPGSWSAPAGAGSVSYGYSWLSCDAGGQSCSAIAGANGSSFTVTAAQARRTLRVALSAADSDGIASAESEASAAVSGAIGVPNGIGASDGARLLLAGPAAFVRAYGSSALVIEGRLLTPVGAPIAGAQIDVLASSGDEGASVIGHASTGADGSFSARVPRGPSRVITLAYRSFSLQAGYTASAHVGELVRAGVLASTSRRRTSSYGRVTFSGRVLGASRTGVIVELLVRYRGRWQPIRTPRTAANGTFRISYVFRGAGGAFPFKVTVPGGQAGFPYAAGASRVLLVRAG